MPVPVQPPVTLREAPSASEERSRGPPVLHDPAHQAPDARSPRVEGRCEAAAGYNWNTASENLLLVVSSTRMVARAVSVGAMVAMLPVRPASVTMK